MNSERRLDVLCVGHASFDHVFQVDHHPGPDEKLFAESLLGCGGGPAANAAVAVARLGYRAAFSGYLGNDMHGQRHYEELLNESVALDWVVRGDSPTPVSAVIVKPDGARSVICYKGDTGQLTGSAVDFAAAQPAVLLFDGHEALLSEALLDRPAAKVLDAGSLHAGTESLMFRVDYLACSEKFACQWLGADDPEQALQRLGERSPAVVVTLGERGLIWRKAGDSGALPAFPVRAVDSTGAGDAFHGALAAGLAAGLDWLDTLRLASAAGAACCEALGARPGMPDRARLARWLPS